MEHPLTNDHQKNVQYIKDELGFGESFDILAIDAHYAGREMTYFMVDGMVQGDIMHYLMRFLAKLDAHHLDSNPLETLLKEDIPYVEVSSEKDLDKAIFWVMTGCTVLLVEGINQAVIIDARTYPTRNPQEPDVERVVRGPRDGFVETIVFNTALTRRRVRDPSLRMEYLSVGRRSKTDICIGYIKDIANPEVVKQLKEAISTIDTDGLPMAEKTIEEFIAGRHFNPFPIVRYTERPDTAAVHLFEGHVLVFVDGSPVVLIAPSTYWNQLQHVEEYRQKPIIGSYLRFIRYLSVGASVFFLPLWYVIATHPDLAGHHLKIISAGHASHVPLILQILLIEIGFDALRMATIHTPTSLATALGLVAAIMIGQMAVSIGLFSSQTVIYMSFVAIGTFATPLYELSIANRLARLFLILLSFLFGVSGFVLGSTALIIYLVRMNAMNMPYMWPFIPFSIDGMREVIFRTPIPLKTMRPPALNTKDPDR